MSWRLVPPSAVTLLGILCGAVAVIWAPEHPYWACNAVIAAALCDMIDGRVARLMGATSRFGAHLDSLADVVSFGVAPAVLVYVATLRTDAVVDPWFLVPAAYLAAGAVRLARFNVLEESGVDAGPGFVGVPIPVGALLVTCWLMLQLELDLALPAWSTALVVLLAAAAMVSPWRFRDYKRFRSRLAQVAFFGSMVGGLAMLFAGLPGGTVLFGVMAGYLVLGLLDLLRGASLPRN